MTAPDSHPLIVVRAPLVGDVARLSRGVLTIDAGSPPEDVTAAVVEALALFWDGTPPATARRPRPRTRHLTVVR